ncbi:MAG: ATP-binding cassette domain-containing protein [Magnetococcales bacterium]|nr:ATP-binding cassette domain-containing protein [Magnetococcales bacterium]
MNNDNFFNKEGWPARLTPFSMVSSTLGDLVLISLMINLLGLALPLTLLQVYDRILQFEAVSTLSWLLIGVVAALLLEAALKMGRSYIGGWLGARFEHLASCSAMERLLTTNLTDFEGEGAGVHLERMNALSTLKEFYSGQAVLVILDLPFVVIYLGLIYHLAGSLVFMPITMFFLFLVFVWVLGKKLHKLVAVKMEADDRRINFIIEVLTGIHSVKSMAMEAMMLRRYERLQDSCAKGAQDVGVQGGDAQNIGAFFSQLSMVGVVSFGGIMVVGHELTIGGLAACTMLSGRALQPLQRAVGIWTRFQTIRLAKGRLSKIFELKPEARFVHPPIPEVVGRLEMRHVSFRFSEKDPPIINNVNLDIAPGEMIGISGENGSGKTILLWLMMGALKPTEGQVLIDGYDLDLHDPRSIQDKVAYLPQVGMLFKGTILENIHLFRTGYEDAAVDTAVLLQLEDFVSKLPRGYETVIDDGADESIPKGIKQRITIARSLVTSPKIVLFDEANTALDGTGDDNLRNVLADMRGVATVVLVSARPSLLELSDRVYQLKNGTVSIKPPRQPYGKPAAPPPDKNQAKEPEGATA